MIPATMGIQPGLPTHAPSPRNPAALAGVHRMAGSCPIAAPGVYYRSPLIMKLSSHPQIVIILVVSVVSILALAAAATRFLERTDSSATMQASPRPPTVQTPGNKTTPAAAIYLPLVVQGSVPATATPELPVTSPEPADTPKPTRVRTPNPATDTPKPPRWPEPLAEPGRSRLGVHVIWNTSPDILEFVRRTKPAVVKAVDDVGWLAEAKRISPKTVTIGRLSLPSQTVAGDPAAAAQAFVAERLRIYQEQTGVDYWEGWNEPDTSQMAWYAAFEAERARIMAGYGLKVAVGGFAAGTPEWDQFIAFLPAIQAAQQYGGILTLHEYDAPTFDRSVGTPLPGQPGHSDRGALALRYRWWYEDILKPRGLVVPLVISEAGIDGGIRGRPGPPEARGWRDFAKYWSQSGLSDDPVPFYVQQLAWYDSEMQKDDYVLGFTVYTAGPLNAEWESFDITDILPKLAYYVVSQK